MNKTSLLLSFDALKRGELGITEAWGKFLAEGASHCLHHNGRLHPVSLNITGDVSIVGTQDWSEIDGPEEESWADPDEAVEYGAYGMAIIVALPLTETSRVERSAKGPGFDYWLKTDRAQRGIFQKAARMEVSGTLRGDDRKLAARVKRKLAQTTRSKNTGLPAYAVIVDFGRPETRFFKSSVEAES